jgi:hypothetical protein
MVRGGCDTVSQLVHVGGAEAVRPPGKNVAAVLVHLGEQPQALLGGAATAHEVDVSQMGGAAF